MHKNIEQHKINTKKLKPGLVAFYDIQPGNRMGPFSRKWLSKEKSKPEVK